MKIACRRAPTPALLSMHWFSLVMHPPFLGKCLTWFEMSMITHVSSFKVGPRPIHCGSPSRHLEHLPGLSSKYSGLF